MDGPGIRAIMQVALTVDDMDRAIRFYRDALGLKLLFIAGPMAFFDCGGTRILVSTENPTRTKTLLYFDVADIHASWKALASKDVELGEEPHLVAKLDDRDVWLASFRDPAGTLHHLMSEVTRGQARQ